MMCIFSTIRGRIYCCWVDNFNRYWAVGMLNSRVGSSVACNWTVEAIKAAARVINIDITIENSEFKALPDDLFTREIFRGLRTDLRAAMDLMTATAFDRCVLFEQKVNTIPPKLSRSQQEGKTYERMSERGDSLKHFFPDRVVDENIGSNEGLIQMLLRHDAAYHERPGSFRFMVADVNIYFRCMKVVIVLRCDTFIILFWLVHI